MQLLRGRVTRDGPDIRNMYWVKLLQIYTANHSSFPIQIRKITVQICGNFWVNRYNIYQAFCWISNQTMQVGQNLLDIVYLAHSVCNGH